MSMSEGTLWVGRPAMFRNHPVGFLIALLLTPLGIGILILLIWWLKCLKTSFTVTTHRTILRHGLLSKSTSEVRHADIRNIQLQQSFSQRLFGTGTIGISSSGQSGIEILISGIANPEEVVSLLRGLQERHLAQTLVPDTALLPSPFAKGGTQRTGSAIRVFGMLGMGFLLLVAGCCVIMFALQFFVPHSNQSTSGRPVAKVPAGPMGINDATPTQPQDAPNAVQTPENTSSESSPNTPPEPIEQIKLDETAKPSPAYGQPQIVGASEETDRAESADTIEAAKWRTWTTADGRHKVDAKFVKFLDGKVTLEKVDGTTVDVRLDILCSADQNFVKESKWQ